MNAKTLRQRLRNDGAVRKRSEASANSPVAFQALIQKERIGLSLIDGLWNSTSSVGDWSVGTRLEQEG